MHFERDQRISSGIHTLFIESDKTPDTTFSISSSPSWKAQGLV